MNADTAGTQLNTTVASGNEAAQSGTVLRGVTQLLIGRGATMAFQFAALVVLGRQLGPSQFGVLQFALAVFVYIGFVADLGLTIEGTLQVAKSPDRSVVPAIVGARVLLALVASFAVFAVVATTPIDSQDRVMVVVLTIGLLATTFNHRWLLQGQGRFGAIAMTDVASAVLQLVAAILLVQGPSDLIAASVVMVLGPIAWAAISTLLVRRQTSYRVRIDRSVARVLRAAAPLGLAVIATQIYYGADAILIGIFRSAAEVGWYAAAYRVVLACLAIPFAAHAVALPLLTRLAEAAPSELVGVLSSLSRGLLLLAVPIAVGTTLTANAVIVVVFGHAYEPSAVPLMILIWSCVTVSANAPFGALMLARGQRRSYVGITVLGSVLNVVANIVIVPLYGMTGAAITTVATELFVLFAIVWKTQPLSAAILPRSFRIVLVPTLAMVASILPIRTEPISIVVGAIVFVAVALIRGALPIAPLLLLLPDRFRRDQRLPGSTPPR